MAKTAAVEIREGTPPSALRSQRLQALKQANQVRHLRAGLKRDLRSGEVAIAELLVDPPEWLLTASVPEILQAVPGLGEVRVNRLLKRCRISPSKAVGGLSERQRDELVRAFGGPG